MALAALKNRRTIRNFDPEYTIPKEQLTEIVGAALVSPTGMNTGDIDYIVITNKDKIKEIGKTAYDSFPKEVKASFDVRRGKYAVKEPITCDATTVILAVKNERAGAYAQVDAGIGIMSLIVAAQEYKIESMCLGCIVTPKVEELLGLKAGSLVLGLALGKVKGKPILDRRDIKTQARYIE